MPVGARLAIFPGTNAAPAASTRAGVRPIQAELSRPQPPLPHITWRGVAVVALAWLLYSAAFAAYFSVVISTALGNAFVDQLAGNTVQALFGLPVWLLVVRGLDRAAWPWRLAAHVVICPIYVALLWQTSVWLAGVLGDPPIDPELVKWNLLGVFFTYALEFSLFHVARSAQKLRWRDAHEAELTRLLREQELAVLRAQLHPHFLFNSLNTISATITEDAEEARRLIARLGDVLRYAVDTVDEDFVPLQREWQLTRSYLDVEQARLGDRLVLVTELAPDTLEAPVPPMVLQPLVENAIRHAIAPAPEGGSLRIESRRDGAHLRLEVANTGIVPASPPDADQRSGTGLRNIRARLRGLYGESAQLHLDTPADGRFVVTVVLPVPGDR